VIEAKCASERLVKIWADAAYRGFIEFALVLLRVVVTIVKGRRGGEEVQGPAPALGGGEDVRLVDAVAAAEPQLRAHAREQPGCGPGGLDRDHGATAGQNA
jgi:hypothetical protein